VLALRATSSDLRGAHRLPRDHLLQSILFLYSNVSKTEMLHECHVFCICRLFIVGIDHCRNQGRSSRIFIGPAKFVPSLPFSSPPLLFAPLPFPFLSLSTPLSLPFPHLLSSLLYLEVGPVLRLGGLEERLSSPSWSGQSPAAKRILVHFELKKIKASGDNSCIDFPENQLTKFCAKC